MILQHEQPKLLCDSNILVAHTRHCSIRSPESSRGMLMQAYPYPWVLLPGTASFRLLHLPNNKNDNFEMVVFEVRETRDAAITSISMELL